MTRGESPVILKQVAEIEHATGRRVLIRGVRPRNRLFRGRILQRGGCIILEYRDDTAGYFWHYAIIQELLDHVSRGRRDVVLYEGDIQYVEARSRGAGQRQGAP